MVSELLTNRKQLTSYHEWIPVISGTPQGTTLGPIVFFLYDIDISDT